MPFSSVCGSARFSVASPAGTFSTLFCLVKTVCLVKFVFLLLGMLMISFSYFRAHCLSFSVNCLFTSYTHFSVWALVCLSISPIKSDF